MVSCMGIKTLHIFRSNDQFILMRVANVHCYIIEIENNSAKVSQKKV